VKVKVNGITMAYEVEGEGDVVVFIHGLGMNRDLWWQQKEAFSDRYRVLTYDLRGHGETDAPAGPYSLALFAQDLQGLLHEIGIEKAAVVGLSLGGMIAQQAALDYPDGITCLTLCDTSSSNAGPTRQVFEDRARIVEHEGMGPIIVPTLERWLTPRYRAAQSHHVDRIATTLRGTNHRAYADSCRAVAHLDLTARLGSIRQPTLVVVGAEDKSTSPEVAQVIAQHIPEARLEIIPAAAHLVPVEAAEAFNSLLRDFLTNVENR
jgi:3-oxoadipate enol-lactonase